LRRIFGPKGDEVTGGRRKFRNEQLHNFCSSPGLTKNNSVKIRCTGHVERIVQKIWVEKYEGKEQLGRCRNKWNDRIKIDLKWNGSVWIGLI
jgi:hypothetical protein